MQGTFLTLIHINQIPSFHFVHGDILDVAELFPNPDFTAVIHFAAESHVDRSILDANAFLRTNILGTQALIDWARYHQIPRFVHVSTDEVYGSIPEGLFYESDPLSPNSPYAASKASSDLMVLAAVKTFGFPAVITRASNNYGPNQFPEKLIPLIISRALADQSLPIYGDGLQIRDWIHAIDHCDGILSVLEHGQLGEVYNIGASNEWANIDIVKLILKSLNKPESLITYVDDRLGHDRRYALDTQKIQKDCHWKPKIGFEQGIQDTIAWYQENTKWIENIKSGDYLNYIHQQYGSRKGSDHG